MHPAFSVIFFTVASGTGFGLFVLLYMADSFGLGGGLTPHADALAGLLALSFVGGGLLSSTFHLANPRNAWRAFTRWRTSWLAREGVFAVAFFPFALTYIALAWFDVARDLRLVVGFIACLFAWATLFSTGMIYACLKTIRQWNTPLVPTTYIVLGHFSGAMLLLVIALYSGARNLSYELLALALLVAAALVKAIYYFWVGQPYGSTINTATGFTRATVRLLDAGHTHHTFLTREFGFQVGTAWRRLLKVGFFFFAVVVPATMLAYGQALSLGPAVAAAVCVLLGLVLERWLFFAEARHVVNLFHGAQRT